jgi:hypothetical protein
LGGHEGLRRRHSLRTRWVSCAWFPPSEMRVLLVT